MSAATRVQTSGQVSFSNFTATRLQRLDLIATLAIESISHMVTLFFSYSHIDEALRDELEVQLSTLKRQGIIKIWHDRRIGAGEEFDKAISKNLEEADIILLLVSPSFLASDYIHNIELQRAMERHERQEAIVLPVILRHCDWEHAPFGNLLAVPRDGKPVSKFPDRDEAFLEVVQAIRMAVSKLAPDSVPVELVKHSGASANPQVFDAPRSSNLRIRQDFTEHDRDKFLEESFEYIANFFENSLIELLSRNPGVENRFRRIDASNFTATIYICGKAATECRISIGAHQSSRESITYSHSASMNNSYNESISIADDGYALLLRPLGLATFSGQNANKLLSQQGSAEYFWDMLIERLQR